MTYAQTVAVNTASLRKADFAAFKAMRDGSAKLRDRVREARGMDPFPVPPVRITPRPHVSRRPATIAAPPPAAEKPGMPIYAQRIVNEIAAAMVLDAEEIYQRSRVTPIVRARFLVMAVLHGRGNSYSRVGRWLGCDHSTVIHGVRRFKECATPFMREVAARYLPEGGAA